MRYRTITESDVIDGLSVRYLKIFGVWQAINEYRSTGKRNTTINLQVIIILLYYTPFIIFQSISFFVIKIDIHKLTFIILNALIALQILSKMLVFWFHLGIMSKLFSLIKKDFLRAVPEQKREEVKEIYLKITKNCNIVFMTVFLVFFGIVAIMVSFPVVSIDYIVHHTGSMAAVTGGKKKVLGGWYPVPMAESPYYEAIYVYESFGSVLAETSLAVYICVFYKVLMCLYAQFTVLGYYISTLNVESLNSISNNEVNDSALYEKLYAVLLDHQKLISFTKQLRSVFNPLITIVLGMGMFVLTISIFEFGGASTIPFVIRSLLYLVYEALEISIFCFGSSAVEAASSDLHFAIYSSDWYKADIKFRKAAQMLMVRAKKGETLTAIGMYPVNVETIMAICQFTYSVATLMSRTTA